MKAVSAYRERSRISLQEIKKAIAAEGFNVKRSNARINRAVKILVLEGALTQVKGTGARGSFCVTKHVTSKKPIAEYN
ncbi:hypothetical protein LDENG_00221270 [Lucifuga dentata]|nr:hypothetical protein LDENG_00221270 [Lucifuga dentata]